MCSLYFEKAFLYCMRISRVRACTCIHYVHPYYLIEYMYRVNILMRTCEQCLAVGVIGRALVKGVPV